MEESIFVEALGRSPVIRILDHFITGREIDFSLSDIAEGADVGWMTVHRALPKLVQRGIIKQTRTIGQAKMFKIDAQNQIAQRLINLYDELLNLSLKEVVGEEMKVVA